MNLDKLHSCDPRFVTEAAYTLITAAQQYPAAIQVGAVALLFREMAEVMGLDVSALLNQVQRIAKDSDTNYSREIRALRNYIKGELV